ncbi:MAG: M20/M25/M40 family metallo-hydrolase [Gemmatimonadetes bacterium]|nr:M20/M25/M40 family metallo-hydrolase [Gemmatimonadota bacterium]
MLRTRFVSSVLAVAVFAGLGATTSLLAAQQLAPHQQLLRDVYKELIEINTSVITSGTTVAAEAMAKRFRDAGFPERDIYLGGPRADKHNIVVRLRGRGGANAPKPLLLLAHLDVVEALKSDWSDDLDPFKFLERDGFYYGRGTTDDKAQGAIFVANLIRMKQDGFVPDRDIILALTADEEGGGFNGVRWLLQNQRALVDAAFVVNEGGRGALKNGKPIFNEMQATQKNFVMFTVTAKNRGGHSSVPRPDNAIYQLAEGIARFSKYNFPVKLNTVTRVFFERTAAVESPEVGAAMTAIVKDQNDAAATAVLAKDPRYNSMLRTTCVATGLTGGHASNALPQTAQVSINCRILPDAVPTEVRDAIIAAFADPELEISAPPARAQVDPSSIGPEMLGPVELVTREVYGDIPVIPSMSTGATDSQAFRVAGIPAYGVSGIMNDVDDIRAHGRDERLPIKSLYDGQEFLYRLTKLFATTRTVP